VARVLLLSRAKEDDMNAVMRWFKTIGAARGTVVTMATGLVALGADAAVSHFAGREMRSVMQLVPVIASPIAFVTLMFAGMRHLAERTFRRIVRIVGAILAAVGAIGTTLHLAALMRLLAGGELTWSRIEDALAVAPPLGAPGSFLAFGVLLWAVVSPRISLTLLHSGAALPARA
jgi:hypothetical protein